MSISAPVIEVDEAAFQQEVLDRSHEVPVVVDLWAEWCGPCKQLGPVLESLATEADGGWVLAKVDVDRNQQLAAALGVQGIPAVRAFKDGRQIAEFVGALPESKVREWLGALGPSEGDLAYERGVDAEKAGDLQAAASHYRDALVHAPGHTEARRALAAAELALRSSDVDLDAVGHVEPTDVEAVIRVADAEMIAGRHAQAFARLNETVRLTSNDTRERARAHLVALLETRPTDDPVVSTARRELARSLF